MNSYNPAALDQDIATKFFVDDPVTVRNEHPIGQHSGATLHSWPPRHDARDHGVYVFCDRTPSALGQNPQHCYSVMSAQTEVWGKRGNPRDRVYVDLWDDHLAAAAPRRRRMIDPGAGGIAAIAA